MYGSIRFPTSDRRKPSPIIMYSCSNLLHASQRRTIPVRCPPPPLIYTTSPRGPWRNWPSSKLGPKFTSLHFNKKPTMDKFVYWLICWRTLTRRETDWWTEICNIIVLNLEVCNVFDCRLIYEAVLYTFCTHGTFQLSIYTLLYDLYLSCGIYYRCGRIPMSAIQRWSYPRRNRYLLSFSQNWAISVIIGWQR